MRRRDAADISLVVVALAGAGFAGSQFFTAGINGGFILGFSAAFVAVLTLTRRLT